MDVKFWQGNQHKFAMIIISKTHWVQKITAASNFYQKKTLIKLSCDVSIRY